MYFNAPTSLMEQFANPDTFGSLDMGERLVGTGITALLGMGITFTILILLWFTIAILSRIVRATERKPKEKGGAAAPAAAAAPSAAAPAADAAPAPAAAAQDDGQLIAVLTAAIAAAEGSAAPASNLVFKKIQRMAGPTTAWGNAGVNESFDARRMY